MPYQFVVTHPFEGKEPGYTFSDPVDVERILAKGHVAGLVKVWVDEPEPVAEPKPAVKAKPAV